MVIKILAVIGALTIVLCFGSFVAVLAFILEEKAIEHRCRKSTNNRSISEDRKYDT